MGYERYSTDEISRGLGGDEVVPDQAARLKELQAENARLERAVAELTLDKLILEEAAGENSRGSVRKYPSGR